jgi:hypothetical protein
MNFMTKHLSMIALLALMVSASSPSFAKDRAMLIDQVPPMMEYNQTPLDDSQHQAEQAQLSEGVARALNGKYKIIGQKIYLFPLRNGISPIWVAVRPDVGNFVSQKLSGKEEFENLGTNKIPSIAVFKVGFLHPERMALAMMDLSEGGALIGYFEVEKE